MFSDFFKSRFFIIALVAALLLSIVPGTLCVMGQGSYLRSALQIMATPFQWVFTKIGEGLGGYSIYFESLEALREENARLKAELEEYDGKVYNAELIEEQNEYLRSYLGLKAEHSDFLFEEATVVGREAANYRTVYTLSKGSMHGIKVNMPVVTDEGVVGCIIEVGATFSRAISIVETAAAVGAYDERSGELGIVEGDFSLRFDGFCRMVRIDADADVRVGDRILTSGVGSIYPRGLSVGRVSEVKADANTRTLTAVVLPDVNFVSLSKVMIITDYNVYSD